MKFKQTDKILLVGRSGCGKSSLGKKLSGVFHRLVVFDSLNEYPKTEKNIEIHSISQFISVIREISQSKPDKFNLIIKIDTSKENLLEEVNLYFKILYELGDCFIVIEEAQDFCTPYNIPPFLKKCMTSGRHKNLGFIFTTQRPAFLNKTVLSQSTHIFIGNLIDKNDNLTMSNLIDSDKKTIQFLDNFEFLWFCPTRKPHTIKIKS